MTPYAPMIPHFHLGNVYWVYTTIVHPVSVSYIQFWQDRISWIIGICAGTSSDFWNYVALARAYRCSSIIHTYQLTITITIMTLIYLPPELHVNILTYLRATDLSRIQRTCQTFNDRQLIHSIIDNFANAVYPPELSQGFDTPWFYPPTFERARRWYFFNFRVI